MQAIKDQGGKEMGRWYNNSDDGLNNYGDLSNSLKWEEI